MSTLYVETSSLLRVLFQQENWKNIVHKMEHAERLVSCRLLRVELFRALCRLNLQGENELLISDLHARAAQILSQIDLLELSKAICTRAEKIFPQQNLRSLEALHVAAFLYLREQLPNVEMLSEDERVKTALGMR
jgi:predicted nucleic acid-binding protein